MISIILILFNIIPTFPKLIPIPVMVRLELFPNKWVLKQTQTGGGAEAAGNLGGSGKSKKESKWVEEHMKYAERQGKPWPLPRPEHFTKNEWYGTLTNREQDGGRWVKNAASCKLVTSYKL